MEGFCGTLQTRTGWLQSLLVWRNNPLMFFMAILVASLNIADAFLTQFIIAHGGSEVNPIAQAAISTFGNQFWLWKHTVVSLSVIMLSSHIHLRMARVCLAIAAFFYSGVTVWHLILIDSLRPII
jgi:hypothetical protein